jgi:hypothetical protein
MGMQQFHVRGSQTPGNGSFIVLPALAKTLL